MTFAIYVKCKQNLPTSDFPTISDNCPIPPGSPTMPFFSSNLCPKLDAWLAKAISESFWAPTFAYAHVWPIFCIGPWSLRQHSSGWLLTFSSQTSNQAQRLKKTINLFAVSDCPSFGNSLWRAFARIESPWIPRHHEAKYLAHALQPTILERCSHVACIFGFHGYLRLPSRTW